MIKVFVCSEGKQRVSIMQESARPLRKEIHFAERGTHCVNVLMGAMQSSTRVKVQHPTEILYITYHATFMSSSRYEVSS